MRKVIISACNALTVIQKKFTIHYKVWMELHVPAADVVPHNSVCLSNMNIGGAGGRIFAGQN